MDKSDKPIFKSYRIIILCRFLCATIISLVFLLLYTNPIIGGIILLAGILPPIIEARSWLFNLKKIKENKKIRVDNTLSFKSFFRLRYVLIFVILLIVFCSPLFFESLIKFEAENNKDKIAEVVDTIIKNSTDEIENTKSILAWFDQSKKEMHKINGKNLLLKLYPLHVFTEEPYICVRVIAHDNPLWILSSRCGACEEYSLLFSELAHSANLTVRSVHNHGEDHNWDEVLINDSWIIVDPISVDLAHGEEGFNLSANRLRRGMNISYIFAEYQDGKREDITHRYVNVSNVTISALNQDHKQIPKVDIAVFSNNYKKAYPTELNCTTDYTGKCGFSLGAGEYFIKAKNNELVPLCGEITTIINESNDNNVTITLDKCFMDPQILPKEVPSYLQSAFFSLLLAILLEVPIIFYLELLRLK